MSITTAPETPAEELQRRQRRYAVLAVVFIGSFAAAALLHNYPVVAVPLSVVAMVTLVLAVIGANIRTPRRGPTRAGQVADRRRRALRGEPPTAPGSGRPSRTRRWRSGGPDRR